jgi:hypothetical protein
MSRDDRHEVWQSLLARDRDGNLRRARDAARRAVALAQTPVEEYRAATLLAIIECELGHHRAELQQARRLVNLEPRNRNSLLAMRRAAECNGMAAVAQQSAAALRKLDAAADQSRR